MRNLRSFLVLLVVVVFGVSLAFPAEDLPETPYDESETLPFESTPVYQAPLSGAIRQASAASIVSGTRAVPGGEIRSPDRVASLTILDHVFRC